MGAFLGLAGATNQDLQKAENLPHVMMSIPYQKIYTKTLPCIIDLFAIQFHRDFESNKD